MGRIIYTAEAAPFASGDALETFESRDFRVASGGVCWIIRDNRHISCELFVKTLEYSDCTTVANFRNSLQSTSYWQQSRPAIRFETREMKN